MKVRLKSIMAGPRGVADKGTVVEVDEAEGRALLEGGYADLVERAVVAPPVEVAVAQPAPEDATADAGDEAAAVTEPAEATEAPPTHRRRR
jgi:hypothetical protein